ncbi:SinI family autotransporter-associated protein [Yersinia mollaretii]|uniref:SinI family autotransporter-associated protein n=1 Tax=Yersinia mollaretii TaxID=33060 RepID=UPI0011A905B3|nr:SinI family autotransporter-associated protein [Yersinia mollaretii]
MMKQRFALKKIALALLLAGCTLNGAHALMTQPTGSIQGAAPVLSSPQTSKPHTVQLSSNHTANNLSTGDKITATYRYTDNDGDEDNSTTTVRWYYVKAGVETEVTSVTNVAATATSEGSSTMVIPGAAYDTVTFKMVIQELSLTGDPITGQTITINDVTDNIDGGTVVPPGPVTLAGGMVPAIYASSDTAFTTNLIGGDTKLNVGETYVFKLWNDNSNGVANPSAEDMTNRVSYEWRLLGSSATDGIAAPADTGFKTNISDGNFTVPKNAEGKVITNSADGVQGFNLAVDYTVK